MTSEISIRRFGVAKSRSARAFLSAGWYGHGGPRFLNLSSTATTSVGMFTTPSGAVHGQVQQFLTKVGRIVAAEKKVADPPDEQEDLGEDLLEKTEARAILNENGVLGKSFEEVMTLIEEDEQNEESERIHGWLFAAMEKLGMDKEG